MIALGRMMAETGAGNAAAEQTGKASQRVRDAAETLRRTAREIVDEKVRTVTLDALDPNTCVAHRAGLNQARKSKILDALIAAELLDAADETKIPGGLMAGVFPPLLADDSPCPKLPQPLESAPGSTNGGHHSYPGGLAIHEAFNLQSSLNFANLYRHNYGPGLTIDQDVIIAAPIWHDWAKMMVFQWNADGTEFQELNFGGRGESKTPAHHILGLAETMKRGLPPHLVIAQASAHYAPAISGEPRVVNWLRAAAILAQVNPVERGYLIHGPGGEWRIPKYLPEYSIHNLSDADFVLSIPAVSTADFVLRQLAHEFGYDPADRTRYNTKYRNVALSQVTAIRILFEYASSGLEAVRTELSALRGAKIL